MNTTTLNIKNIKTSLIRISNINPRKSFNEESLAELAESIKAQGILQPIIVSDIAEPSSEYTYEIICGERRFRAALMLNLETIPAIVKLGVNDGQLLEMALTENIIREDITPLEEMLVYKKLVENQEYSVEKICEKFGKSEGYIRSRIKLSQLSEEYHQLLQNGDISLSVALELCQHSKETQVEVYEDHFSEYVKWQNWRGSKAKDIIDSLQKSYSTKLEDFFFDKLECYNCGFNSKVVSLFTDEDLCGRCMNRTCLRAKNTAYIVDRAIMTHEQNPELPLARYDYRNDESAIEQLSDKGYEIQVVDYCKECPVPPVAEEFETEEEYQAELADFMEETTELTQKYQKGEIAMYALVGNRGVSLAYRNAGGSNSATNSVETPLVKLKNQDIRNKEIAVEKSIADTKQLIRDLDVRQGEFSILEEQMTYFAMAKQLRRENFDKFGIDIYENFYLTDQHRWQIVQNLTEEQKVIIKRDFILDTLKDAHRGSYTAVMLNQFAEQHADEQLKEIQDTHNAVYEKRHTRIIEKIAVIKSE